MHVLVTGASGYLGATLLHVLAGQDSVGSITALVRQPERFAGDRDRRFPAGIDWAEWHADPPDLSGVDVICHLAADRGSANPEAMADSLALAAGLFRQAAQQGVKGIVNASSQAVYGRSPPLWSEASRAAPASIYGTAKLAQELLAENASQLAPAMRAISLRMAKLVGPAPVFRVKADEYPHVIARQALAGKNLILPLRGQQRIDLLDVRDAALAIGRLVATPTGQWPTVMNLGSGRQVTVLEVARMVLDELRRQSVSLAKDPQIVLIDGTDEPLTDFGMSTALLERTLGWKARFTLGDTVRDVISLMTR